jgi:hypothetical protein
MAKRISAYRLCRHTLANGRLCRSAALGDSAFCHHHRRLHGRGPRTIDAGPGLSTHVLHPLRNAGSIQQALAMVLTALAAGRIDSKRAGRMLYALNIASSQLKGRQ